ncbi:hypothetical protein ACFQ0I_02755 [Mariniflexile aquimaris]|uniref:Uncharacterized protein n=1 Tax=Mariniflexile aquimaris TaxID=881009 RepID=A0ABW3BNS4_9FLAO
MASKPTNTTTCADVTGVIGVNPNEACGDGYVFDYELNTCVVDCQIINNLTGKADCVYGKLESNSLLVKTVEKFKGKTPVNLIINQKSNLRQDDYDTNSNLVHAKTYYGDSYNITITLNTEQVNNRPSLAVARTILHEAIHADIYRKIKTTSGLTYINN